MTPELLKKIAAIGQQHKSGPSIARIKLFNNYFDNDSNLKIDELAEPDGNCTRRELLARFLLLNAVLDQGPDMEGVRQLLCDTLNVLYDKKIRILHTPLDFFKKLNIVIDNIDEVHLAVKELRSQQWAELNHARANRYNLFMDNSLQTLNYAIFRWGVPLALIMTLQHQSDKESSEALLDFLESDDEEWRSSAEMMSRKIKSHKKYGMGKAIGDKAAHLFAKWIVYSFPITRKSNIQAWGRYSYEAPFDSNAGRVLFRSGYLLRYATIKDYVKYNVIQRGKGRNSKDYIRVTNIRDKRATKNLKEVDYETYSNLCVNHLRTHVRRPIRAKYEIQKIPLAQLLEGQQFVTGKFDDGLMYIGTNHCFNHDAPECLTCPINDLCVGRRDKTLIEKYRT